MNFLNVHQIYFHESQLPRLEYIPYYNKNCTIFFENSVIRDLIESGKHKDSEYFGVVSYQLREKNVITKDSWRNNKNIANISVKEFTPELFESELLYHKPDIMSFQRHSPHDPVTVADQFHPNFSRYFKEIMNKIGYDWKPTNFEDIIYCNSFVAKSEIYERYAKEMLAPAMDIMKEMPELSGNAGYSKELPDNLKKEFGINYYPYHPFLIERFFSYFAWMNNLNVLHF